MYDLKAFDSNILKFIHWWSTHILFAFVICVVPAILVRNIDIISDITIVIAIVIPIILWFAKVGALPGYVFAKDNKLEKFFLRHSNDWGFIKNQFSSMKQSSFVKSESIVWTMHNDKTELAVMFTTEGGCIAWLQLDRKFPHLVVDSLSDNAPFRRQFRSNSLPSERVNLEGNFPNHFNVYQESGKQIMTLQILSPDRMHYLVEDLKDINLEIQDNYLRLYDANAQNSSPDFQKFLYTLNAFEAGLKTERINEIR